MEEKYPILSVTRFSPLKCGFGLWNSDFSHLLVTTSECHWNTIFPSPKILASIHMYMATIQLKNVKKKSSQRSKPINSYPWVIPIILISFVAFSFNRLCKTRTTDLLSASCLVFLQKLLEKHQIMKLRGLFNYKMILFKWFFWVWV